MFFSLIRPEEGREREASHERMVGAYSDHQWLWQLFPAERGSPRDFLFRRRDAQGPQYYVVSKREPESPSQGWSVLTRPYQPQLDRGDVLQFELRANPVVTISGEKNAGRHDVVMHAKRRLLEQRGLPTWRAWQGDDKPLLQEVIHQSCATWLRDRGVRHGFVLDEACLSVDGYQRHAEKSGKLQFSTVDFSGALTVTEPDLFSAVLKDGLGRAKAFGCGLFLVRR